MVQWPIHIDKTHHTAFQKHVAKQRHIFKEATKHNTTLEKKKHMHTRTPSESKYTQEIKVKQRNMYIHMSHEVKQTTVALFLTDMCFFEKDVAILKVCYSLMFTTRLAHRNLWNVGVGRRIKKHTSKGSDEEIRGIVWFCCKPNKQDNSNCYEKENMRIWLKSSFLSFSEDASHVATCRDSIFLPTSNAMSKELQPSCSKGHAGIS